MDKPSLLSICPNERCCAWLLVSPAVKKMKKRIIWIKLRFIVFRKSCVYLDCKYSEILIIKKNNFFGLVCNFPYVFNSMVRHVDCIVHTHGPYGSPTGLYGSHMWSVKFAAEFRQILWGN